MPFTKRQIIIVGIVIAAIIIAVLLFSVGSQNKGHKTTLTVWGVYDDKSVWGTITKQYQQETGNTITYIEKNPETYEQELIDALASGNGPDIFYFKNTWLFKHLKKIAPAPAALFTAQSVDQNYPRVVARDFTSNNNVYAIPLSVDTLALFYNPALLDQAAIAFPPKTWEELIAMVPKLKKVDTTGAVQAAAVSMGTGSNVNHASDLLSLLMMQSGSSIVNESYQTTFVSMGGESAMTFMTQFARLNSPTYTWNQTMDPSLEAFAKGQVALAFGYASDIGYIRSVSPYFDFKIAPMPQPASATARKDYASYWGLAVSKQSNKYQTAWDFISQMTQIEPNQLYAQKTNMPAAKRIILQTMQNDPVLGVFAKQAYTALSWPQPDPELVNKIFVDAIDAAANNRITSQQAISSMATQIDQLFNKAP